MGADRSKDVATAEALDDDSSVQTLALPRLYDEQAVPRVPRLPAPHAVNSTICKCPQS